MGATSFDVESAPQENNTAENTDTADFVPVPEERKKRARRVSIIICTITATLVIAFWIFNRNVVEYYPDGKQKNTTNVCYIKREKLTFSGLFTTALGLFGIVLGTLVDRLTLIAEERHHLHQRYGGSWKNMIKACFSGIVKGPVIALLILAGIIVVILIIVTGKPWLELNYFVYIFSGIGVGPLIMHLLSLNTQSDVHISTILEEKGIYIANVLAWSYYFNYLSKALPRFQATFPDNIRTSVQQDQSAHVRLSLNKLILLISHDCETEDNLEKQDNMIKREREIVDGVYRFPVYSLPYNGREYRFVIKYVKQPLEALDKMSKYERIKALQEKQRDYQVQLLHRTLSDIVNNPLHNECKEKCIIVSMKANSRKSLNNGGLVNAIMRKVEEEDSTPEHVDGFQIVPSTSKTKQPKATEDDTSDLHGKIVDLPHKVSIYPVKGIAQYSKRDCPSTLVYPEGEQEYILESGKEPVNGKLQRKYKENSRPSERQRMLHSNYETSRCDDIHDHTKQARECKRTQNMECKTRTRECERTQKNTNTLKGQAEMDDRQSIGDGPKESGGIRQTDNRGGEEYERRPATSDRQPISAHTADTGRYPTSNSNLQNEGNSSREDSPPVSNRTWVTESQSLSSDIENGEESCPRDKVDNERPVPSSNRPANDCIGENQDQPMSSHVMDNGKNSPRGEEEDKETMPNASMSGGLQL